MAELKRIFDMPGDWSELVLRRLTSRK